MAKTTPSKCVFRPNKTILKNKSISSPWFWWRQRQQRLLIGDTVPEIKPNQTIDTFFSQIERWTHSLIMMNTSIMIDIIKCIITLMKIKRIKIIVINQIIENVVLITNTTIKMTAIRDGWTYQPGRHGLTVLGLTLATLTFSSSSLVFRWCRFIYYDEVSVGLSRKIITSSLESPVTTCNHP